MARFRCSYLHPPRLRFGGGGSRTTGFTLIELIIVIVLIGIIGTVSTRFIVNSVQGYVDTAARQSLANSAFVSAEKISRSLRAALPNSVRASSGCIEYIPIEVASHYTDIPVTVAADSFTAVSGRRSSVVKGRAVVYPITTDDLYAPGNNKAITAVTATLPAGTGEVTVALTGNHQFPTNSPTRRFYIVGQPVAFCQQGTRLYRYSGYGFNDSVSLPPASASRDILVNQVSAGSLTFNYLPASLVRNAVVNFSFTLVNGDESYRIEQEANLRNVP